VPIGLTEVDVHLRVGHESARAGWRARLNLGHTHAGGILGALCSLELLAQCCKASALVPCPPGALGCSLACLGSSVLLFDLLGIDSGEP
jgi:hypothetical protein